MRSFKASTLAVAALTLATVATPSLAGSLYYNQMGEPMTADEAGMAMDGMVDPDLMYAQPRARGVFTCSPEEQRTKLQRKACGATRNVY